MRHAYRREPVMRFAIAALPSEIAPDEARPIAVWPKNRWGQMRREQRSMARFQAATRRAGAAFAHGCVLGHLFGTTKPRALRLALHKSGLRRSDRRPHNRLLPCCS